MPINQTYDETAGHRVIVATMAEGRPLLRAAVLGAYVELVSVMQRNVKASLEQGMQPAAIDTRISVGDLIAIEPWAHTELAAAMVKHGLLTAPDADGRYRLVEHPKLVGWDTPEQVWWSKERRKDTRDPMLELAVRHRDGDQCRVCRDVVHWGKSKTDPRGGTLDHVDPRTPAGGDPGALAVACRTCNGIRSDRRDADEFAPHQDVPERPYYTDATVKYLRDHGIVTYPDGSPLLRASGKRWLLPRLTITPRPRTQRDTATEEQRPAPAVDPATSPSDPAPSGITHPQEPLGAPHTPVQGNPDLRPGTQPDHAAHGQRPAPMADHAATECDPTTSGTPHHAEPPQNPARTTREPSGFSPRTPPIPPGNPQSDTGGLPCREGKGREGTGEGGAGREASARPARRGRRGRNRPSEETP